VNQYLRTKYRKGGRGPVDLDCWGLVRLARVDLFNKPLLPSYDGISPDDKPALTTACLVTRDDGKFREVDPTPGAIATGWQARLCVHVGLVVEADGRLWILETMQSTGPALTPIRKFARRYTRVLYYND
jgi:hypothetical protein